jgi:NTP pyrophosphatase (non-canonical NTP hydrolase)
MGDVDVIQELLVFVEEREWSKFHSAENLAKSVVIEASELLECFQWGELPSDERVEEELADVLTYCYLLAARMGLTPHEIVRKKLEVTRKKYPVDRARGRSTKYDQL